MAELAVMAGIFITVAVTLLVTDALPVPREALYILTGLFIGQFVAVPDITALAEAGAVLLIFLVTANLQIDAVMDVLPTAAWAVSAQAGLLVAAAAAALLAGLPPTESLLLGMACSMSSSMLGVDMIGNQVDRRLIHGRLTEAISLGQDIGAVLIIASLPLWPHPTAAVAAAVAGAAVLTAIRARHVVGAGLHWLARNEETTLISGLMVLWLVIAAGGGHPYSSLIGAIVAGLLFTAHPAHLTLLETLEPVRDFFAALFFVVLGVLAASLGVQAVGVAAALVVVIALVRPALTLLVLRQQGVNLHAAFLTAFQLDQVSELVLLLTLLLGATGSITPVVFQAVVLAAAVSFIIDAATTRHANRLYAVLHAYLGTDHAPVDRTGHTIIAGYGGWGRAAAAVADDPVIIDNDPDKVARATRDGYTALLGDIRDHMAWYRAALAEAAHVILTVPDDSVATRLAVKDMSFRLVAITDTEDAAARVRDLGAVYACDDVSLASTAFREAFDDALDRVLKQAEETA